MVYVCTFCNQVTGERENTMGRAGTSLGHIILKADSCRSFSFFRRIEQVLGL